MNGAHGFAHAQIARLPRVLIVGYNFDLVTGGGITLTNLFKGWPLERLAVADFHACEVDPAPCSRQYLLGSEERHWTWPVSLVAPKGGQPSIPDPVPGPRMTPKTSAPTDGPPKGSLPISRRAVAAGVRILGGQEVLRSLSSSPRLVEWTRDLRPDLIYTQLASLGMIRLVTQLAERLELPIALHIMDDWPSTIYDGGLLGPHFRAETDRSFRAIVAHAAATMAISQRMADVYRVRYSREWDVFHNPVDIGKWTPTRRRDWSLRDTFRLIYAGRVGQGIESSLVDICLAVAALKRAGLNVHLDIFTPSQAASSALSLATYDGVSVHPAIEDDAMPETLASADLLVLPYDFTGRAAAFACLSYPTKAPAYMATGVPVLVYAPREHALAVDAREKRWALTVSTPGVGGVATAIRRLASDEDLRKGFAQRAVATCESLHDARAVRQRFRSVLARSALPGSVSA